MSERGAEGELAAVPEAGAPSAEDVRLYEEIEALAAELARAGGEQVQQALEREISVEYKPDAKGEENARDPVSEVDHAVEALVRERIAERFPDHAFIGEEGESHPAADVEYAWVVDPVDGTTNFVNGFPLFAVAVGVLRRGDPVVGATWCATTHALRPGVYHARAGGPLCLDGTPVARVSMDLKRRLAAAPGGAPGGTREWDHRVTGSMAIEGAYVAAGIFTASTFWGPKLWDVASTVALVRAAGGEAWTRTARGWQPFERFEAPERLAQRRDGREREEREPSLRDWSRPLVVGTAEATALIRERARPPGPLARLRRWLRRRSRR